MSVSQSHVRTVVFVWTALTCMSASVQRVSCNAIRSPNSKDDAIIWLIQTFVKCECRESIADQFQPSSYDPGFNEKAWRQALLFNNRTRNNLSITYYLGSIFKIKIIRLTWKLPQWIKEIKKKRKVDQLPMYVCLFVSILAFRNKKGLLAS